VPEFSTVERSLRAGPVDDRGFRSVVEAAGVEVAGPPVALDGEVIAAIAHLSDLHLCDAESPARQEYLFRHSLPGAPYRRHLDHVGGFRPQEFLTAPVAIQMIDAINAVGSGVATGRPFDAAIITGDITDNAQQNEFDWYRRIVGGGEVLAISGDPTESSWVGAPAAVFHESYWHPERHPNGTDLWVDRFGFPFVDGVLAASRQRLSSRGLDAPGARQPRPAAQRHRSRNRRAPIARSG